MQTFLTDYPHNGYGLENLDGRRLVKQLLETRQIMAVLAGATKGWVNHPATKMWRGKEDLLFDYGECNARELSERNYKWENNLNNISLYYNTIVEERDSDGVWGREYGVTDEYDRIVYTHRGRLYEKDAAYYAQWAHYSDFKKYVCCERCNYYWPSHIWEKVM